MVKNLTKSKMETSATTTQARPLPKPLQKPSKNPKKKGNRRNNNHTTTENGTTLEESLNAIDLAQVTDMGIKTPVSILQEILSRQGITPSYELVRIEGAHHEPTFRYRVWYNDKDAIGAGKSKKEAKHSAAKALIDKLTGVSYTVNEISTTVNGNIDDLNSSLDSNVFGNPIGWLQELCTARRWPPPMYENELELGLPHERQFTIACVVSKYREVGQGKSKKIAKRLAAHKMWINIHKNALAKSKANQDLDDDVNAETTTVNTDEVNYIQFLQEIATEHQFEIKYGHIEDKTVAGRFQCLVQLSTLPVAVCQGTGTTAEEAQANAAHNALEYLKIMTKS
ncbi:interferon-inducible double-stranded RNA-dependent protein kinase activator A homolog isoform X5 [Bradysia coprophila]|uniref:interferon-inducible double-stranded RNA-dependent protein kinase activator A homolog isoform X5 n=1 Tax=Bradysia coprophila TaxID=38358 RepID=UPI00187DCA67|nr:interferon-inducible double-stranded RNA-dependent protein kinase activator A homolog isoform X5 [Bradysia coprophila]